MHKDWTHGPRNANLHFYHLIESPTNICFQSPIYDINENAEMYK